MNTIVLTSREVELDTVAELVHLCKFLSGITTVPNGRRSPIAFVHVDEIIPMTKGYYFNTFNSVCYEVNRK